MVTLSILMFWILTQYNYTQHTKHTEGEGSVQITACFVKKLNNIFNRKSSWPKLVSPRRSTAITFPFSEASLLCMTPASTLSTMMLSILTLLLMTLNMMTVSIIILSTLSLFCIMNLRLATFGVMPFNIKTLSTIMVGIMTFSIAIINLVTITIIMLRRKA